MDWDRVEPIYDSVLSLLHNVEAVGDLPGQEEVGPLIAKHCQDIGPSLLMIREPVCQMALNQSTFYIALVIGLLYCQQWGLPDWATVWLRGPGHGHCLQDLRITE